MTKKFIKVLVAVGASVALLGTSACQSGSLANTGGAATGSRAKVTIKFLNTNDKTQIAVSEAMAKAFNAAQDKYFVQTDNPVPAAATATTSSRPASPPVRWPTCSSTTPAL
jgi:ABC-type glycerol-3-phosphate transport system substrate-binding protein